MKLDYTKIGDYYISNLYIPKEGKYDKPLGKYGIAKLEFMKKYKRGLYTSLMMKNELERYLRRIELKANVKERILIREMMKKEHVDEQLKEQDQMKWVGLMNNIKHTASDIVMRRIICI